MYLSGVNMKCCSWLRVKKHVLENSISFVKCVFKNMGKKTREKIDF